MQLKKILPALLAILPAAYAQDQSDVDALEQELKQLAEKDGSMQRVMLPKCRCVS